MVRFEWDSAKERANRRKHGVSFHQAASAFGDEYALLIDDPDHSDAEDRFVLLGASSDNGSLVVCHCYREPDDAIRIISARKATRAERETYRTRWNS